MLASRVRNAMVLWTGRAGGALRGRGAEGAAGTWPGWPAAGQPHRVGRRAGGPLPAGRPAGARGWWRGSSTAEGSLGGGRAQCASGSDRWNAEPSPGPSELAVRSPPCARARPRAIVSPMPEPSERRWPGAGDPVEPLEDALQVLARQPRPPVSLTSGHTAVPPLTDTRTSTCHLGCGDDRIPRQQEVGEHLADPVGVGADRGAGRCVVDGGARRGASANCGARRSQVRRASSVRSVVTMVELRATFFGARERGQVLGEAPQQAELGAHGPEGRLVRREDAVDHPLDVALDGPSTGSASRGPPRRAAGAAASRSRRARRPAC